MLQAGPAAAVPGPTLFESGSQNAQELLDIVAARGKGLPDLVDVPEVQVNSASSRCDRSSIMLCCI